MSNTNDLEKPNGEYLAISSDTLAEPFTMTFSNGEGKQIGELQFLEDKLQFDGEADESAKLFFKFVCDMWNEANRGLTPVTLPDDEATRHPIRGKTHDELVVDDCYTPAKEEQP